MGQIDTIEDITAPPKRVLRNPLDAPIGMVARRFGSKSREVERFIKFAIVGASGAVVDFGILIILQATILPPTNAQGDPLRTHVAMATAIAFFSAVISNFIWTRAWVYPESRSRSMRRQLAQFTFISVVGGVARTAWVTFMSFKIGHLIMPAALPFIHLFRPAYEASAIGEAKLGTIMAQTIGMAVVMLWNFFANRYWTYNDVE